jgi:hypothetical protein
MSSRATSILRSTALLGAATAASAMLAQVAVAKAPGPRVPGQSPYFYSSSLNQGFAPRPEIPGGKQADTATTPVHTARTARSKRSQK